MSGVVRAAGAVMFVSCHLAACGVLNAVLFVPYGENGPDCLAGVACLADSSCVAPQGSSHGCFRTASEGGSCSFNPYEGDSVCRDGFACTPDGPGAESGDVGTCKPTSSANGLKGKLDPGGEWGAGTVCQSEGPSQVAAIFNQTDRDELVTVFQSAPGDASRCDGDMFLSAVTDATLIAGRDQGVCLAADDDSGPFACGALFGIEVPANGFVDIITSCLSLGDCDEGSEYELWVIGLDGFEPTVAFFEAGFRLGTP